MNPTSASTSSPTNGPEVAEPRRAGPLAALSVLGAGAGWGVLTGVVAGTAAVIAGAESPSLSDLPGALTLGLLYGAWYGGFLGLPLALLPAVTVGVVRTPRSARLAAAVAYVPGAALLAGWLVKEVGPASIGYAALYGAALLFGWWRCQRSAACAVERVARRRAAPPVIRPGVPLEEPSVEPS